MLDVKRPLCNSKSTFNDLEGLGISLHLCMAELAGEAEEGDLDTLADALKELFALEGDI